MQLSDVRRRYARPLAVGIALPFLGGCDILGVDCDTGILPAVTVAVVDARTGLPAAEGASGYVQEGAFRDSLRVVRWDAANRPTHLGAADERAGTYTIVVERPGYAPWSVTQVRARDRDCHALAPEQRAELTPSS